MVFWLYGRSGAGKTTLSERLKHGLTSRGLSVFPLDGDELRSGLCSDLGFGEEARTENHRRAAEMAQLVSRQDIIVLAATMAPQHVQRNVVTQAIGADLRWVYVDAPYEVCAGRDPKGLYRRAAEGTIDLFKDFPFDSPRTTEVDFHVRTDEAPIERSYQGLLNFVLEELAVYSI